MFYFSPIDIFLSSGDLDRRFSSKFCCIKSNCYLLWGYPWGNGAKTNGDPAIQKLCSLVIDDFRLALEYSEIKSLHEVAV